MKYVVCAGISFMSDTNCHGGAVITILLNAFEQCAILSVSHIICQAFIGCPQVVHCDIRSCSLEL